MVKSAALSRFSTDRARLSIKARAVQARVAPARSPRLHAMVIDRAVEPVNGTWSCAVSLCSALRVWSGGDALRAGLRRGARHDGRVRHGAAMMRGIGMGFGVMGRYGMGSGAMPALLLDHDRLQRSNNPCVLDRAVDTRLVVPRPRQPGCSASTRDRQTVLLDHDPARFAPGRRRQRFRLRTPLIAVFSSARSAHIRLSFAFSASSSRRRYSSGTPAPAYLAFQ